MIFSLWIAHDISRNFGCFIFNISHLLETEFLAKVLKLPFLIDVRLVS